MNIVNLLPHNQKAIDQAAAILVEAFSENWPNAWPTMDSALEEVREALGPERICRIAVDDNGDVLGWIGGISGYGGNVWELHPLAVKPACQKRGIGWALMVDFEEQVKARGGLTV